MPLCESPNCIHDASTERRRVKLCRKHAQWIDVCFPSDGALQAEFEATITRMQAELDAVRSPDLDVYERALERMTEDGLLERVAAGDTPPPTAAELDAIDHELAKLSTFTRALAREMVRCECAFRHDGTCPFHDEERKTE